ncbi:MAG: IclR family transcriptional regulator [Gemmatimonadaceae bacterium]
MRSYPDAKSSRKGPKTSQRTVPAVHRALDVFELLREEGELTLTQIASRLALPKSSTYILLTTLTNRGYSTYSEQSRCYSIGPRLWQAGQGFRAHHFLIEQALPAMRRVTAELNETTQLAVLDDDQALYLAKVNSAQQLRLVSEVGRRLPARASGIGKVLLSGLSDAEFDRLYPAESRFSLFTPSTIPNARALKSEILTVRRRGYAIDNEEYTLGVRCVAVPICGETAEGPGIVAAISATFAAVRWSPRSRDRARDELWRAAASVSEKMGANRYAFPATQTKR